jgi:hypothetical protein
MPVLFIVRNILLPGGFGSASFVIPPRDSQSLKAQFDVGLYPRGPSRDSGSIEHTEPVLRGPWLTYMAMARANSEGKLCYFDAEGQTTGHASLYRDDKTPDYSRI